MTNSTLETVEHAAARLRSDLAPFGGLENFFFDQIARATVLIACCERHLEQIEAVSPEFLKMTRLLMSHRRWLFSSLHFLSKLQAERATRELQNEPTRLASIANLKRKPMGRATAPVPQPMISTVPAGLETAAVQIARSAPCPCGSGQKYKRCCGRNAPPLLGRAAA